ncbi:MAG: Spy/CpxP family protein refolding chaperone [Candidatus Fermentithermobacillus carboniphilus]|uniref:Spy/CpxP family protein refolding chaperone n=1 Tax=Candidatus Fermentithermobacillus carboniphilus TaxID=3085328 RepID=A0AAT9LC97_9FIRM|nr:MAG: Spy/CpxP family protein refolding chaperone [Candidatus Fermentithermobacillus carboniphilus]
MKRATIIGLAVLFTVGLAVPALAQGFKGGAWCGGLLGLGRDPAALADVIAGLGLSDDQVANIQSLQQTGFEKLQSIREAVWKKQQELRSMLWQKNPDKNAISAKWDELRQLRQQMNDLMQELRNQMQSVLTQEQLNKLQQNRPCGRGRWGANGQNRPAARPFSSNL